MEFNSLVPEISVSNFDKSYQFYVNDLGFHVEYDRIESKFAFLSLQGMQIMIEEKNGNWETGILEYPYGRGINFQILVSSVDEILNKLEMINYPLMQEVKIVWYRMKDTKVGHKEFLVQDPDGYLLRFAERIIE